MSLHLLQKSLKLFEETDEYKKKRSKRIKKEAHKKRKQLKGVQNERKLADDDILKKIQQLDRLGADIPVQISDKLFSRTLKTEEKVTVEPKKEEESTIFTEEDFEKFEREYNFD